MEATARERLLYPDSDGVPMAENTLQYQWITTLKGSLDARLPDFVAGDLFWYPVEGRPDLRRAPDVLVAFGRPKGHRGSYLQWREAGVPPQVVIEILSPSNRGVELARKHAFYEEFGVLEYLVIDPDHGTVQVGERVGDRLVMRDVADRYTSGRLGIRLDVVPSVGGGPPQVVASWADGERLLSHEETVARLALVSERAEQAEERAEQAEERAEQAEERAARLAARLRALGLDPDA